MSTHRLLAAGALTVLALAAACSSSSAPSSSGAKTTTTVRSTTTAAPATTTTPAPTVAATGPTTYFPSRDAADNAFVLAWQNNDKATALKGATPAAVQDIFTQSASGYSLYGCDEAQFTTSNCNWRNRADGGYAHITLTKTAKGWYVSAVYVSTDG